MRTGLFGNQPSSEPKSSSKVGHAEAILGISLTNKANMTPKQEIKKMAKSQIPSIVEERIILETLDGIEDWSGELVGKLTSLSDDEKEISRAWEAI